MKNYVSTKLISIFLVTVIFTASSTLARWKSEDEISLLATGGSVTTQSYGIVSKNNFAPNFLNKREFNLNINYLANKTNEVTSTEKWDVLLSHEKIMSKKYSIVIAEKIESNRFSGLRRRYNSDISVKYTFTKKEKRNFFLEVGYRYTSEESTISTDEKNYASKAKLAAEVTQMLNKIVTGGLAIEYLPAFETTQDYLLYVNPSLSVSMTKRLSLKVSYKLSYDSTPIANNASTEYVFSTGVLANF